jgi:NAD(P)-dependent dehydrogenase (short-subunit alcohol dehydrogenase family)
MLAVHTDVTSRISIEDLAESTISNLSSIDIWTNNAGIYPITPILDLTHKQWAHVLDVNLTGTFFGAQEAARRMVNTGTGGVIINLASVAAYRATTLGASDYVSAKHAVRGLTKSLAAELGRFSIRVLAIAPTTIDTPGLRDCHEELISAGLQTPDTNKTKPLGRDGVPDDIARVALFCASDLSALMSGSTLLVDGGMLSTL